MFRPINSKLDNKLKTFNAQKSRQAVAGDIVNGCVTDVVGQRKTEWKVVYDPKEGRLTIETHSKTLASELLLRSGEITALMRQQGMPVRQLIVR